MYVGVDPVVVGDFDVDESDFQLTDDELLEVANFLRFLIDQDTREGVDAFGKAFVPYSESYARFRMKKGRNTTPVDLTFTGQMMAGIATKTASGTAVLFFPNRERARIANFHNSLEPRKKIPLRRFFALEQGTRRSERVHNLAENLWAQRND